MISEDDRFEVVINTASVNDEREVEVAAINNGKYNNDGSDNEMEMIRKVKSKRLVVLDSDSEEDTNRKTITKDIEPEATVICNDNIKEMEQIKQNFALNEKPELNEVAMLSNRDSEKSTDEISVNNSNPHIDANMESSDEQEEGYTKQKSRIAALCDSESSEDESSHIIHEEDMLVNIRKTSQDTKTPKIKLAKQGATKKMSGKEAQQQRQEIRSESQRFLRESRVELPYHKPKSWSIKEFLQKRPKLSVTSKTIEQSPSVALKMSFHELEVISKQLEERKKIVQKFYKSESESDCEEPTGNEKITGHFGNHEENGDKKLDEENKIILDNFDGTKKYINDEVTESYNDNDMHSTITNQVPQPFDKTNEDSVDLTINSELINAQHATEQQIIISDKYNDLMNIKENIECDVMDSTNETKSNVPYQNVEKIINENNSEDEYLQKLLKKYESCKLSSTLKPTNENILKHLTTSKPSLSGKPNGIIELEQDTSKYDVASLMERFMRHTWKNNEKRSKVQLDVINLTQGEIIKETVAISVNPEDDALAIIETPGIKLKKLRNELQSQINQRRAELWQQKHFSLGLNKPSQGACIDAKEHFEENALDDEEEEETELTEDEDYDEEYELAKSDDNENIELCQNENEESDKENEHSPQANVQMVKKKLRRILKGFADESDDESSSQQIRQYAAKTDDAKNIIYNLHSLDAEPGGVSSNQLNVDKTPNKESKSNVLALLTPVHHLTGLQNFNSNFLHEESADSSFCLPPDPSPLKENNWNVDLSNNLFANSETTDSGVNIEDIVPLCSGNFLNSRPHLHCTTIEQNSLDRNLDTQDVLNMCSGNFSNLNRKKHELNLPLNKNENLQLQEPHNDLISTRNEEEVKQLDDDNLISQLLDEEEMEQFKKKFESPNSKSFDNEHPKEIVKCHQIMSDNSVDEEMVQTVTKKDKKRGWKRLSFSDDSSEDEEENEKNKKAMFANEVSDDDEEVDIDHVGYDSEENEIEFEAEPAREKLKLTDFLENEAELSESEWGSADEDEKDLDILEIEQGDRDVFDENQLKSDLEKIHMRKMLDEDNREIKILQELYLEDGELHGSGRQRQFRWKNIDNQGVNDTGLGNSVSDVFLDEEESEEQWRKMRHQREMFLKQSQDKQCLQEDVTSTNIFSLKLRNGTSSKCGSDLSETSECSKNALVTKPMILSNTRGSFLSRTNNFLSRLAEYTKDVVTESAGLNKNVKKVVFQKVNQDILPDINKKRKLKNSNIPEAVKKPR